MTLDQHHTGESDHPPLSRRGFLQQVAVAGSVGGVLVRATAARAGAAATTPAGPETLDRFLALLDGQVPCDVREAALSTHGSWVGLVKTARLGFESVYRFYGRKPGLLSRALLTFDVDDGASAARPAASQKPGPLWVEETDAHGLRGLAAFCAMDILCYHLVIDDPGRLRSIRATFHLPPTKPLLPRQVRWDAALRQVTIETRVPRTDKRDPEPDHPLTLVLRLPAGIDVDGNAISRPTDSAVTLSFDVPLRADEHTFIVGIGEGEESDRISARMATLPTPGSRDSRQASRAWLRKGLAGFNFDGVPEDLRRHYAMAACQLLGNTKAPRGRLRHRSAFPSRGTYCSHYLWDACLSTMGVAQFNEPLAWEYLLNLCENREPDGKIPQFICSSWNRPGDSQPPLIAWAAWRLHERSARPELLRQVYEPLCGMVNWWFDARDADGDGLVEYLGRLEAGWDNSPRFEKGRIAGADLNAYLNREMLILSRMADVLGHPAQAREWTARRDTHAERIRRRLFDEQECLFFDRIVETDALHRLKTPACFMPLATGVPVDPARATRMIERHLLNEREFFGPCPFPVVAYDEPSYTSNDWWRGPVWMNIAWLMTEVLRLHGFEQARREAVRRLMAMLTRDLQMAELYDSRTGEPQGCRGYGWTCSVFMEMLRGSSCQSPPRR